MKKILVLTVIVCSCLFVMGMVSDANAGSKRIGVSIGDSTAPQASTLLGNSLYAPSANVQVYIETDADGTVYCGGSQHSSAMSATGGKRYETSSQDPAIPAFDATATGPTCSLPS